MSPIARDIRPSTPPNTLGESSGGAKIYTDSADHELVQHRLGMIFGMLALILAGFLVLMIAYTAIALRSRFWAFTLSPSKLAHLIGVFLLAGAWQALRGRSRTRAFLAATDLIGTLIIMVLTAIVIALMPEGIRADLGGCVVYILFVTIRAALVPSPPRWTVLVSAIAMIPIPLGGYVAALRDPTWPAQMPHSSVFVVTTGWCLGGIAAAWAISHVVYGLRAEVKSAMRLGQYTLEEKIGEGGMGEVYRASHALLQRPTAIKLLSPDQSGGVNLKRFEREVQLTSKLTHPNTIAIYDFGHTRAGVFYYAMELIDGVSLEHLVEEDGPQTPGRVVHILAQMAGALAEAHECGLIHRDVKPANTLLSLRGGLPDFVKVLDFGLVKETGETAKTNLALTTSNTVTGTPHYMAPESVMSPDEIDARVDIYALGAVAYWLLTGATVFEGHNLVEILSHHVHTPPKPPSASAPATWSVPAELDALVLKCLAKDPAARPVSARALASELHALEEDGSWTPWNEEEARAWWNVRQAKMARTAVRTGLTTHEGAATLEIAPHVAKS
jgi:hypothetical protein